MADIRCAWCKKKLGSVDAKKISHGICIACSKKLLRGDYEKKKSKTVYINPVKKGPMDNTNGDVKGMRML